MTVEQVLVRMLERLDDGRAWTQGVSARDAAGQVVAPWVPSATRWCLLGAADRALPRRHSERAPLWEEVKERLRVAIGLPPEFGGFGPWNDAQVNFGPVQTALRAAIEGGK